MSKTVIDWTKPIEWFDGRDTKPGILVGQYDGKYVVGRGLGVASYNEDGTYHSDESGRVWIRNVPPPKIEKTVVVLLFDSGECFGIKKEYADHYTKNIVARKTITITEGEGL